MLLALRVLGSGRRAKRVDVALLSGERRVLRADEVLRGLELVFRLALALLLPISLLSFA
jgi:hypothetical protein